MMESNENKKNAKEFCVNGKSKSSWRKREESVAEGKAALDAVDDIARV